MSEKKTFSLEEEMDAYYFEPEESNDEYYFHLAVAYRLGLSYTELMKSGATFETVWDEEDENNRKYVLEYVVKIPTDIPAVIKGKFAAFPDDGVFKLPVNEVHVGNIMQELDTIVGNKDFYPAMLKSISSCSKLNNEIKLEDEELNSILKKQIFVSVISAFEAFLAETIINLTMQHREFLYNWTGFEKRRYNSNDIDIDPLRVEKVVREEMLDVIYHRLARVKWMYEGTFKIEFPDHTRLDEYIKTRHDLVHRNGKDKDGNKVEIGTGAVNDLIYHTMEFVTALAKEMYLHPESEEDRM